IGVMDQGRLEQVATPRELYEAPASRWIAEFVGDINIFEGQLESREAARMMSATGAAATTAAANPPQPVTKSLFCVAIRPEKVKLSRRGPVSDASSAHAINRLEGIVTEVSYLGGV